MRNMASGAAQRASSAGTLAVEGGPFCVGLEAGGKVETGRILENEQPANGKIPSSRAAPGGRSDT